MKKIRHLLSLIKDLFEYNNRLKTDSKSPETDNSILVEFKNPNLYHRFFYIFLKQLQLSGYKIYFPMNFEQYRNIKHNNVYFGWIVNEKNLVSIYKPKNSDNIISIKDDDLSADFFHDYFHNHNTETGYHMPMTYHPMMFHQKINEQEIDRAKRINSLLCFGNFAKENYLEIDSTPFKVINRYHLLQYFSKLRNFVSIKSSAEFQQILIDRQDEKHFFVEKEFYSLPIEDVRKHLSHFNYFLACPGVVMPHCHNIIEALSVETIPILQEEYAQMFYPHLVNDVHAFTFRNKEDLQILISKIFETPEEKLNEMRNNIKKYYQTHLTPNSISENIIKTLGKEKIFLNAEHRSVNMI